jgi:hypothetical protein
LLSCDVALDIDPETENAPASDAGAEESTPAPQASVPAPKASVPAPKVSAAPTPSNPASKKTSAGPTEHVVNDEIPMALPYHMWSWKDQKNNRRMTCMVLLPVGTTKDMLTPRISAGGNEIKVDYIWPNAMLDVKVPMFMGSTTSDPFYDKGHVKVANFRDSVKSLKRSDEKMQVKSVFRVDTLFPVEEQFTKFEVPAAVSITKFPVKIKDSAPAIAKCLVLEMMGVRDSYQFTAETIDEFCCDLADLTI